MLNYSCNNSVTPKYVPTIPNLEPILQITSININPQNNLLLKFDLKCYKCIEIFWNQNKFEEHMRKKQGSTVTTYRNIYLGCSLLQFLVLSSLLSL